MGPNGSYFDYSTNSAKKPKQSGIFRSYFKDGKYKM